MVSPMKNLMLAGLLALTSALPASAEGQADLLAANLMPGWRMDNGHYMSGLNLTLAPHWKTYWRAPGEAGIPPQFDWSGSQNVGSVRLHWPSPQVITLNGMQSIGYLDALLLPVEVTPLDPAKPVALHLEMQLGICKDICMPASLTLSADLAQTRSEDGLIAEALKLGPVTARTAGLQTISCVVAPIDDGLHITAQIAIPAQGSPETVVFETADSGVWVAGATAQRSGKVLNAATDLVAHAGAPFALDRSGVTVTVIGQTHSVEINGCPAP